MYCLLGGVLSVLVFSTGLKQKSFFFLNSGIVSV